MMAKGIPTKAKDVNLDSEGTYFAIICLDLVVYLEIVNHICACVSMGISFNISRRFLI